MILSTRYGLVGVGSLALLTTVHWFREMSMSPHPTRDYLLGVMPNFSAAVAITFVLLSIWSDQNRGAVLASAKRPFYVCALISCCGLLAWEAFQKTSNQFVFDPHDVGATLLGVGIASVSFFALTPRERHSS